MSGTICDALMSDTPGELTFPINRELIGAGHHRERRRSGAPRCATPSRN